MRETLERIEAMREAHESGDFPPSRGPHCAYCDNGGCRWMGQP